MARLAITLDKSFREFYYWCKANDVPVIVVSRHVRLSSWVPGWIVEPAYSGMAPFIRAVLSKHIGDKEANEIEIISNDVDIQPDGKWRIKYRHPSRWVDGVFFSGDMIIDFLVVGMATTSPERYCLTGSFPAHQLCSSLETEYQV